MPGTGSGSETRQHEQSVCDAGGTGGDVAALRRDWMCPKGASPGKIFSNRHAVLSHLFLDACQQDLRSGAIMQEVPLEVLRQRSQRRWMLSKRGCS